MKIYRIILYYGGTLEEEDLGFVYSSKKKAEEDILDIANHRVSYGMEDEASTITLLEEEDENGKFFTKHCTTYRLD